MLADPQSVTVSGTAISLPRTGIGANLADYTSADGTVSLRVQQSISNGTQSTIVSLKTNKITPDPLTAVNKRVSSVVSVSVRAQTDGFTVAELVASLQGIATALTASSAAMATKVLSGEK